MDPNQNTSNSEQPQVYGPAQAPELQNNQQPQGQGVVVSGGSNSNSNNKKPVVVAVAIGVVLLLVVTVVAVMMANSSGPVAVEQPNTEPQNPQPATTIGIEQLNNSISNDLSSIDDAKDFPEDQLSDEALGL